MNKLTIATLSVLALTLAACSGSGRKSGDSGASDGNYGGSGSSGTGGSGSGSGSGGANGAGMPSARVVYFELDSAELTSAGQSVVQSWAAYLAANPSAKLRLEGHCDERGTREYNVSLGERRGNSVRTALAAQGVAARQLSVTSYGEERPVDLGHGESAWTKNRRVELVP